MLAKLYRVEVCLHGPEGIVSRQASEATTNTISDSAYSDIVNMLAKILDATAAAEKKADEEAASVAGAK